MGSLCDLIQKTQFPKCVQTTGLYGRNATSDPTGAPAGERKHSPGHACELPYPHSAFKGKWLSSQQGHSSCCSSARLLKMTEAFPPWILFVSFLFSIFFFFLVLVYKSACFLFCFNISTEGHKTAGHVGMEV